MDDGDNRLSSTSSPSCPGCEQMPCIPRFRKTEHSLKEAKKNQSRRASYFCAVGPHWAGSQGPDRRLVEDSCWVTAFQISRKNSLHLLNPFLLLGGWLYTNSRDEYVTPFDPISLPDPGSQFLAQWQPSSPTQTSESQPEDFWVSHK